MRTDSSAATRNVSMRRVTSPFESLIGLPASMHSASASSSKRSRKRATQCSRIACRLNAGSARSGRCAATAAAIAASIARASASATRVATLPLYLSVTSRPVFAYTASFAR